MKPLHALTGAVLASCSWNLPAQSLGPLVIEPSPATANQTVRIVINSRTPAVDCGLEVSLGDGTVRQLRGETFPLTVEHVYSREGIYAIAVTGRAMLRGLRSLLPCQGTQTMALQVSGQTGSIQLPRTASVTRSGENSGTLPMLLGGMSLNELGADQARLAGFPAESYLGLLVQAVEPGSAAQAAGLLTGDVLSHLDDEGATPSVAARARHRLSQGRPTKATVFRAGQWLSSSLMPHTFVVVPSIEQTTDPRAREFAKSLGQSSRVLDDQGAAPSGHSSKPLQLPPVSISGVGTSGLGVPASSTACKPGAYLEPRQFTQPEILGRPKGQRAQMCFYRMEGARAEYLNFFSTGHFYYTSIAGSGGFASTGAVYGTVRGSYGFQADNVLVTRTGYQGTGVSQSTGGAGIQKDMDFSGQTRLDREMTLPNCQKITYRDETQSVRYDRTTSHPSYLMVNGVRWERYSMDCPAWTGWVGD